MKVHRKKTRIATLAVVTLLAVAAFQTPLKAVLGVVFIAAQGPSVPKVMSPKQVFEKKCSIGEMVTSENPAIIKATMLEKKFILTAQKPGTTTVTITKNDKVKKKHSITVAYSSVSELPNTVEAGTVLYCVSTIPVTCKTVSEGKGICKVTKKRKAAAFFYEIKFLAEGRVEISDENKTRVITVTPAPTTQKTKSKKHMTSQE